MNPQEFKALISMWQEKNNDIKQSGEVEDIQRVNGRVLWQRAKDRVMYDAIVSEIIKGISFFLFLSPVYVLKESC